MKIDNEVSRHVLVRDVVLFQIKLLLDGLKDIVLAPLSIGAAVMDLVFGGRRRGRFLYAVLQLGEAFDSWLNLYGAAEVVRHSRAGMQPPPPRGADSLANNLEALTALSVAAALNRRRQRTRPTPAAGPAQGPEA